LLGIAADGGAGAGRGARNPVKEPAGGGVGRHGTRVAVHTPPDSISMRPLPTAVQEPTEGHATERRLPPVK
jgi:hypothetical protein